MGNNMQQKRSQRSDNLPLASKTTHNFGSSDQAFGGRSCLNPIRDGVKTKLAAEYIKKFSKSDNEPGHNMHAISACPERAVPDA